MDDLSPSATDRPSSAHSLLSSALVPDPPRQGPSKVLIESTQLVRALPGLATTPAMQGLGRRLPPASNTARRPQLPEGLVVISQVPPVVVVPVPATATAAVVGVVGPVMWAVALP